MANILFIQFPHANDDDLATWLGSFGTVTTVQLTSVVAGDLVGQDISVTSPGVGSLNGLIDSDFSMPVVVMRNTAAQNIFGMGNVSSVNPGDTFDITDAGSPLAGGLTGNQQVWIKASSRIRGLNSIASGASEVAVAATNSGISTILLLPKGGANTLAGTAEDVRVFVAGDTEQININTEYTAAGRTLIGAAVDFALDSLAVPPVISGVTGHNALGTMTVSGSFTLPITSVSVDGVAYTVTGTPTVTEVQATVPKGGIEMGAAVDLVVVDAGGVSVPFSTVMTPPVGSSFVIMSVSYANLPETSILFLGPPTISGMLPGDIVVYENESGGETIVLNSLGVVAAEMAVGDYMTDVYLLDASDSYAAGVTGEVSFSIGAISSGEPTFSIAQSIAQSIGTKI